MDELGPLFVHPDEPHRLWMVIVAFAVPTIGLCLVAILRPLPVGFATGGLLLLPIFGYVLGDLHLLEDSKRVEFCGSCHETMAPLVESLHFDGESLASIHYQKGAVSHTTACYHCHSGYGIWGGVDAKIAGFKHMINTVTGNYTFPLAIHASFDATACLNCHAEAVPFRAAEAHHDPDLQQALLAGEISCAGLCHAVAHPDWALQGAVQP